MAEQTRQTNGGPGGNGERFDARVAGQVVGVRSQNPIVWVLLVCVVALVVWLFQKERQGFMEQMMTALANITDHHVKALSNIATLHREDLRDLRTLAEAHHKESMAFQLEVARATLKVLLNIDYNIRHVGEPEEIPFGTLPPWFTRPVGPGE